MELTLKIKSVDKLIQIILKRGVKLKDLNHRRSIKETQFLKDVFSKAFDVKSELPKEDLVEKEKELLEKEKALADKLKAHEEREKALADKERALQEREQALT